MMNLNEIQNRIQEFVDTRESGFGPEGSLSIESVFSIRPKMNALNIKVLTMKGTFN